MTVGTTSSLAVDPVDEERPSPSGRHGCTSTRRWRVGRRVPRAAVRAGRAGTGRQLRVQPPCGLFTLFDCSCFFVADRRALVDALSIVPEFLRNPASESGEVIDYRDWQVPLGRRSGR